MNKTERLRATLRGEAADRPPWSLWRHFYHREGSAQALADAMLEWAGAYGFDFLKVNPRAHYHVEPWGARYAYSGRPDERPQRLEYPVRQPGDWERLRPVDPSAGALGEQLDALELVRRGLGDETPFIETVFSPLMVAGYMVGSDEQLIRDLRRRPASVHAALEGIAQTFAAFTAACLEAGAAGIFFATTWATPDKVTAQEYAAFGRSYDLRVLDAARTGWLNVLHVCGERTWLLDMVDYPVQAFSWASRAPGNPSLAQAQDTLRGMLVAGLSHQALTAEHAADAEREARGAQAESGGRRWALGPACSVPAASRDANIRAAGRAIGAL
jgi:uroporphyrinogen decarboxylase